VLIVPQLLFTVSICWFLAALGVFLRDLGQIIGFVLTAWFFLTPICYEESKLREIWILNYNPMFILVRAYRSILLENHAPAAQPLIGLSITALVLALCSYAWFHRLRRSFADVI
jgi:lipopolysaccharide transport system permease protein